MLKPFTFTDGSRTYTCTVETSKDRPNEPRWWFAVTGDQQRYAPLEAASSDTQASVKTRIVAYYTHLLERRAMPPETRQHWAQRGKPVAAAAVATPATATPAPAK